MEEMRSRGKVAGCSDCGQVHGQHSLRIASVGSRTHDRYGETARHLDITARVR